jgi:hypothetical protein
VVAFTTPEPGQQEVGVIVEEQQLGGFAENGREEEKKEEPSREDAADVISASVPVPQEPPTDGRGNDSTKDTPYFRMVLKFSVFSRLVITVGSIFE